jgi:hypothetical protein
MMGGEGIFARETILHTASFWIYENPIHPY